MCLKHLDLCSGIGGFALGLQSTGCFKTIGFCEIDSFCQKVLKKNFPGVSIYNDIREFKPNDEGLRPDIITAGFPCQPFSVAGKRKSEKDDRNLWKETLRVIQESRPTWFIGENVNGIVKLYLDTILEDLENSNYSTRCFNISASSIGASHQRQRIWFIAHSKSEWSGKSKELDKEKRNTKSYATQSHSSSSNVSDSGSKRLKSSRATGKMGSKSKEEEGRRNQSSFLSTSSSNVPDSESERTGEPGEPHKEKRLEGGNAAQSNGGGAVDVPDSKDKRREQTQWQRGESSGRGSNDTRGFERKRKNFESDVPDSNEGDAQAGRERQRGVCEKDKVKGQPDNAARPRQALPDSESIGHGGGSGEERGTEQRKFQQKEQTRNEMGSETEGCGELSGGERNVPDSDTGLGVRENEEIQAGGNSTVNGSEDVSEKIEDDANTKSIGYADTSYEEKREGSAARCGKGEFERSGIEEECQGDWSEIIAQFRGIPDGVSTAVDRNRTPRLKSLGNAIVPQIAETIGRAIIKAESRQ